MQSVIKWFENSENVTNKATQNYRSSFEVELAIRKEMLKTFTQTDYELNEDIDIGMFKIMGQNPDDPESCYIGNVVIEFDDGVWLATWYISGFRHYAYGMQVSSNILVFNFSYLDSDENPHTGLVSYTFLSENIVRGQWIEEGYSEKGIEELRKLEDDEIDFNDMHDANFGFSLN
ncbi:hypothetical protein [Aquimarina agarivorans]|uniref:hypothetical protein n=1 Tax=Aquimarina agarivorans TaxID=980584 RepID=UPI000248FDCB|nr:hypothetical protein [Aquimarina agarivorans]